MNRSAWRSAWLLLLCSTATAQSTVVYRCPGPPVLYTDALTLAEARDNAAAPPS